MDFYRRYSLLLGLLALALVMALLLSTPALMFSPGVTFIDSELYRSSGKETYVRTKMDLGKSEHVSALPHQLGVWQGYDYDTTRAKESLGTEVMLLRGYDRPGLYQPIFFLLIQAKTESSFHPPPICYTGMGYEIEEEGKEQILVKEESWAETTSLSSMSIPMTRIVIFKKSGGKVKERRVALYCYVKGNQFTSDTITMIRVEGLAPIEGSYEGILNMEKDFIASVIPYLFEPSREAEWKPLALQLIEMGSGGYLAIALMLFIPLAIIIYPIIRWRQGSVETPSSEK
jgi:hypothetical protein